MHVPPEADEFELSLFGRGIGECILVHFPSGGWMVVDSCLCESNAPVAIDYLRGLGIDPRSAIETVVVSHWHDDHIAGISQIVESCPMAEVWCSSALSRREFCTLVAASSHLRLRSAHSADLSEYEKLLRHLRNRAPAGARRIAAGPQWAIAGTCVRRFSVDTSTVEVHALSPSSSTHTRSQIELAEALDQLKAGNQRRRLVSQQPNALSVALWVDAGFTRALLGADLETGANSCGGWHAVLANRNMPAGRARFYKVAHHGSDNADIDGIWTQMLEHNPICGVTPYASGSNPRPSDADVYRLVNRPSRLYCAGRPSGSSPPRRSPAIDRTANEVAISRRVVNGKMGHVRFRMRSTEAEPSVELFGSAQSL
jgi:beta-lactamase superfamily II metal-dependent hydrolase